MTKNKIDAKQVLDDIRTGMDAVSLMQKYGLSPKGLQSLFEKLQREGLLDADRNIIEDWRPPTAVIPGEKKEVTAKTVWADLSAGMADVELMETYKLSEKGLNSLYKKLIAADLISESELRQGGPDLKRKVRRLLHRSGDINKTSYFGCTLLYAAAGSGQTEIVQELLSKEADVNAPSLNGETAFMHACRCGHREIAELLLKNGADINAQDNEGVTALMMAAHAGHQPIINLLLDNHADDQIKDKSGRTAFMWAIEYAKTTKS